MNSVPHASPRRNAAGLIVGLLSGICLSACSTTAPPRQGGAVVPPAPSQNWVKVSANPPTWYPRGVSADCPTDHHNGEWIYTENSQNARYFIPLRSLPQDRRAGLLDEALAARAPGKVARIAREDAELAAHSCLKALFWFSPPGLVCATAYAMTQLPMTPGSGGMGGMGMGGIDLSGFQPQIGPINCSGVAGCPSIGSACTP